MVKKKTADPKACCLIRAKYRALKRTHRYLTLLPCFCTGPLLFAVFTGALPPAFAFSVVTTHLDHDSIIITVGTISVLQKFVVDIFCCYYHVALIAVPNAILNQLVPL